LTEDAKVYKLVGPVLMSVELEESKSNVNKRLEFIEGEIKKVDNSIDLKRSEQNNISEEVNTYIFVWILCA
jgi:prefoldin beta subunit